MSSGAVGHADPRSGRALRANTPMRVASISKISTALLVMRLADAGRLDLDADVGAILGVDLRNPAFAQTPITARMLLSHTSSMRDGEVYWAGLGERISDFIMQGAAHWEAGAHWSADQAPGVFFTYCNFGFGVLATLIERIEGARFDQAAHEHLLHPLGLECGFNWSGCEDDFVARGSPIWQRIDGVWEAQVDDPLPVGRTPTFLNPNHLALSDYRIGDNGTLFSPQGGLRASVLDLARLGCFLLGPGAPFLSADALALMRAPVWRTNMGISNTEHALWRAYGLGIQIVEPGKGAPIANLQRPLIGHSGDAYGLRGGLWLDPETGDGFAFLFNGGPVNEIRARGERSGFTRAEESAIAALYDAAIARS